MSTNRGLRLVETAVTAGSDMAMKNNSSYNFKKSANNLKKNLTLSRGEPSREDFDVKRGVQFERKESFGNPAYQGNGFESSFSSGDIRVSIRNLTVGVSNATVVGFVIAKDNPRMFEDKNGGQEQRCVVSFTIRDSPFDTINIALWGHSNSVMQKSLLFAIGDIVKIRGVNVKEKPPMEERYHPWTSSPHHITLSDKHSSISPCDGEDVDEFMRLAHMPLQTPGPVYRLGDIVNNIKNLTHDLVSFTAAVRWVGPSRQITAKATSRQMKLKEIKLFDQNVELVYLILWGDELMNLADIWKPCETIVSLTDVKVSYDEFKKGVTASSTSKTIITLNPDTREAASLYHYAQKATFTDNDDHDVTAASYENVDISAIKTEYNIREFLDMCEEQPPVSANYGIVYGFLSCFNIDGSYDNVLIGKCCECGKKLPSVVSGRCSNYDCLNSNIMESSINDLSFNIRVDITDHTGTIVNCKLTNDLAVKLLNCKPELFPNMSDEEKTILKWKYLMERYRFTVKAYKNGDFPISFSVVELKGTTCLENSQHVR